MKSVKIPLLKFHPNKERFLSLDNVREHLMAIVYTHHTYSFVLSYLRANIPENCYFEIEHLQSNTANS
jgi:hypothetical protein